MNWKLIAWFAGLFLFGKLFYSLFGIQASIMKNCTQKLYNLLKYETQYWYPDACKNYIKKVKRTHAVIFVAVSAAVVCFVPLIGVAGYFVGYVLSLLFAVGKTGINENNLGESAAIISKFIKLGMEDEFFPIVVDATRKLLDEPLTRF